jgi:large subunit ribosomal protein L32
MSIESGGKNMGLPKQRHTKSKRNKRRMHIFIKSPVLNTCPKCGKKKLSHAVCWNCGYYKGNEVLNVLEKLDKKERKKREKELNAREQGEKADKPLTMEELSRK